MGDRQSDVIHFIPSVTLKGTFIEKLHSLDLLLGHLQELRRSLIEEFSEAPSTTSLRDAPTGPPRLSWRDVHVAAVMLGRNIFQKSHQ